jgi:class 3 adenylate cyclase
MSTRPSLAAVKGASWRKRAGRAAILAADVVGYSCLMGEDEAGTAKAVREHREAATPIVLEFGSRLVKTMGDGVLLEFSPPSSLRSSAPCHSGLSRS